MKRPRKIRPGVVATITVLGVAVVVLTAFLTLSSLSTSQFVQGRAVEDGDQSYFLAESGVNFGLYRLIQNPGAQEFCLDATGQEIDCAAASAAAVVVSIKIPPVGHACRDELLKNRLLESRAVWNDKVRTVSLCATTGHMAGDIQYAIQANGRIQIDNNSTINGDVYCNGPISGQNYHRSTINGEAWSVISIDNLTINLDAHAPVFEDVLVLGERITTTPPPTDYPFTPAQMAALKDQADDDIVNDNVVISGYDPDQCHPQLADDPADSCRYGPRKINGSLTVETGVLMLTGPVWVTDTIDTKTNVTVRLPADAGKSSGALLTDAAMEIKNNSVLMGSGDASSYLLIVSFLDDVTDPVIYGGNNTMSVIYFAPDGLIRVRNNAELNNTTGKEIFIEERSIINYDSNLSGFSIPGGELEPIGVRPETWQEL